MGERTSVDKNTIVLKTREVLHNGRLCWEWQGRIDRYGYGQVRVRGKTGKAHREAYRAFHGDPGKLLVLHTCDNRKCCNPKHLFLGTHKDNMADMVKKGRHARHKQKKNV